MYLHRKKKGVVYIAHNKAMPSLVKIGVSQNCHVGRIKRMNNQSVPHPFVLVAAFETSHSLEFEQYVHENLKRLGLYEGKEFFRVSRKRAVEACEALSSAFMHGAVKL